jgi:uncharacterized membrane protein (DUF2068 family)
MAPTKTARSSMKGQDRSATLLLIGVFKLIKGLALIIIGVGALHFLHRDLAQSVNHWVNVLRVDPDNRFLHKFLTRILRVSPKQLKAVSAGTFLYAALFLTEGAGLLLGKRWAEYLTIISTGGLIPLEIYELVKHATTLKAVVMAINIAIVVYLVIRLRRTR